MPRGGRKTEEPNLVPIVLSLAFIYLVVTGGLTDLNGTLTNIGQWINGWLTPPVIPPNDGGGGGGGGGGGDILTYTIITHLTGSGTITLAPSKTTYKSGDMVQIQAIPSADWSFTEWSGDLSGSSNPTSIIINGDKTVTATFNLIPPIYYTLSVSAIGSGSGSIILSPPGGIYMSGTVVTLIATQSPGMSFSGWGGDLSGSSNPTTIITMNGNKAVTASFTQLTYTISVTVSPAAGGSVTRSSNGPYHYGDVVTLTESPSTGYSFSAWSGDGTGTGSTRTVTIDGNKAVTAAFMKVTYTPTVLVSVSGSTYYAATASTGTVFSTNTNFGTLMNSLNGRLVSGDVVLIKNGIYTVTTMPDITASHITIVGEGNTVISATSSLSGYLFRVNTGASYVTLDNLIFDANFNTVIAPVVIICGNYNVVQNCHLKNAMQYGFEAYKAHNFKFINNTIIKAQYGIATGGDSSGYCVDGLIQGNVMTDTREVGIKLRWAQNVRATMNIIDVAWVTWTSTPGEHNPAGITFYHADGPTVNCIADNNYISNSGPGTYTNLGQTYYFNGVLVHADDISPSSGVQILNNVIKDQYIGIRLHGNDCVVSGNTITGSDYRDLLNEGLRNVIS